MTELKFTEVSPTGPQEAGDRDLGQLNHAWSRKFSAEFTGDQTYWAIVEIIFYQCEMADASIQLVREEICSICTEPGGGDHAEEFSNVAYFTEPGNAVNHDEAVQASRNLTPADIQWPASQANKIELWQRI